MNVLRTNTILYCHQWQETVTFYRHTFDFPITYQSDWFVEFQLASDSYLSIADESRASIQSASGQGVTLSWQVSEVSEMHAFLLNQNLTVSAISRKWGAYLFYLHDPEGHRIELWQPIRE